MRLFVAIMIPDDLKMKFAKLADEIKQEGINPVSAGNMHITLRFIGESEKADEIAGKLEGIHFSPFGCVAKGVGVFPSAEYIRVVWTGIESGNKLETIANTVTDALVGYGKEEKFSAHLTIARVKRKADLKEFLTKHKDEEFGSFTVSEFLLMKSELGPQGPKYTILKKFSAE